jgi:hypothetical protein
MQDSSLTDANTRSFHYRAAMMLYPVAAVDNFVCNLVGQAQAFGDFTWFGQVAFVRSQEYPLKSFACHLYAWVDPNGGLIEPAFMWCGHLHPGWPHVDVV